MKKIKQMVMFCLIIMLVITSLPLQVLAENNEEDLKTSQTEIIKENGSEEVQSTETNEENEQELIKNEGIQEEKQDKKDVDLEVIPPNKDEEQAKESEENTEPEKEKEIEIKGKEEGEKEEKEASVKDKLETDVEVKEDILNKNDDKKTESIIAKLFARFSNRSAMVSDLRMDEGDIRSNVGLLIIKVSDQKNPIKGIKGAKLTITSLSEGGQTYALKTNAEGVAFEWIPKGKYIIKQTETDENYIKFDGNIEINTESLSIAKFLNIENIRKSDVAKTFTYNVHVMDKRNREEKIEGVEIKITKKDDPSVSVTKITDSNGNIVFNYIEKNGTMVQSFESGVQYKIEIKSVPLKYGNNKIRTIDDFIFEPDGITNFDLNIPLEPQEQKILKICNRQKGEDWIPIRGSKFRILDKDMNPIGGVLTTNNNGICGMKLFENNTYYIKQIELPKKEYNDYLLAENKEILKAEFNAPILKEKEFKFYNARGEGEKSIDLSAEITAGNKSGLDIELWKNLNPIAYIKKSDDNDNNTVSFGEYRVYDDDNKKIHYQIVQKNDKGEITNIYIPEKEYKIRANFNIVRDYAKLQKRVQLIYEADGSFKGKYKEYLSVKADISYGNIPYKISDQTFLTEKKSPYVMNYNEDRFDAKIIKRGKDIGLWKTKKSIEPDRFIYSGFEIWDNKKNISSFNVNYTSQLKDMYWNGKYYPVSGENNIFDNAVLGDKIGQINQNENMIPDKENSELSVIPKTQKNMTAGYIYYSYYDGSSIETLDPVYIKVDKNNLPDKYIKPKLTLKKVDEDTGEPIENVIFTLYDESETSVVDYKRTDENGKAVFKDLKDGTYYLIETSAPYGYKCEGKVKVMVKDGYVLNSEYIVIDEEDKPVKGNGYIVEEILDSDLEKLERPTPGSDKDIVVRGEVIHPEDNLHQVHLQEPLRFEANIKLSDSARAGDTFKIKIDDRLRLGSINYPGYSSLFIPMPHNDEEAFARGTYDQVNNIVTYTLTKRAERLLQKKCRVIFESLVPKGIINLNETTLKPNDWNTFKNEVIGFDPAKNNGKDRQYTKEKRIFINYQNYDNILQDEFKSPYWYRTFFSRIVGDDRVDFVTYLNINDSTNHKMIENGVFRFYNRQPNIKNPAFYNLDPNNVRIYKVPNYLKRKYITRTYGWIDKDSDVPELQRAYIPIEKTYGFEDLASDSMSDLIPAECLKFDFTKEDFKNNEGYIIVNSVKMYNRKKYNVNTNLLTTWSPSRKAWGYGLDQIRGAASSSGEPATKNSKIQLTNYQVGNIYFKKVDSKLNDKKEDVPLQGGIFELQKQKGEEWLPVKGYESVKSDLDGEFEFEGLLKGEYRVIEVKAPTNYQKPDKPVFEFSVYRDPETYEYVVKPKDKEMNETDTYKITNNQQGVDIIINKVDTKGNKLDNVEFKLECKEDLKFTPIIKTTDNEGKLKFTSLQPGTYILTETKPKEGFAPKIFRIVINDRFEVKYEEVKLEGNKYVVVNKNTTRMIRSRFATRSTTAENSSENIPTPTQNINKKVTLKDIRYNTSISDEGLTEIIKPNVGEYVTINMNIDVKNTIMKGEYFVLNIGKGLTINGPVKSPSINLKDKYGNIMATAVFKEGAGYTSDRTNTYQFIAVKNIEPGEYTATAKLFIDRLVEKFNSFNIDFINGTKTADVFINPSNKKRVTLRIDYGQFSNNTENNKIKANFYITEYDRESKDFTAELFFTLGNNRRINTVINKVLTPEKTVLVNPMYMTNSLYEAIKFGEERDTSLITKIEGSKTKLDMHSLWGDYSNEYNKAIGIRVKGNLQNGNNVQIVMGDKLVENYDLSSLVNLRYETPIQRGTVRVSYIDNTPSHNFLKVPKILLENAVFGTAYNADTEEIRPETITIGEDVYKYKRHLGSPINGRVIAENMGIYYVYELVEKDVEPEQPVDPVDPEKPIVPEVDLSNTVTIEIVNEHNEIEFKKTDEEGEVLQGAKFKIINEKGDTKIVVSDSKGIIRFENLVPGEYELTELQAPEGYILKGGVIAKFTVKENGEIEITESNGIEDGNIVNIEFEIPETGINFIIPFMGLGIILILSSASLYLKKLKN